MKHPRTNTKRKVKDDTNYDFVHSHRQCSLAKSREIKTKHNEKVNAIYEVVHYGGQC